MAGAPVWVKACARPLGGAGHVLSVGTDALSPASYASDPTGSSGGGPSASSSASSSAAVSGPVPAGEPTQADHDLDAAAGGGPLIHPTAAAPHGFTARLRLPLSQPPTSSRPQCNYPTVYTTTCNASVKRLCFCLKSSD